MNRGISFASFILHKLNPADFFLFNVEFITENCKAVFSIPLNMKKKFNNFGHLCTCTLYMRVDSTLSDIHVLHVRVHTFMG